RHASAILDGRATRVAGAIRRQATTERLDPARRAGADRCAAYLTNKHPYLDYPTALQAGWPIATGVIEGACRHLVKDRMDLTGARWGLDGAEAILKLRAIRSNGDWDEYWPFHLAQEHQRVHKSRYADNHIPQAA
ncbi:MAG: ISKra4 family transposase, partial [Frankiaceae bacterium]